VRGRAAADAHGASVLKADASSGSVDSVLETLQKTIDQAKAIQEEMRSWATERCAGRRTLMSTNASYNPSDDGATRRSRSSDRDLARRRNACTIPAASAGRYAEEAAAYQQEARAIAAELAQARGSREMEVADSVSNLGLQAQRQAGARAGPVARPRGRDDVARGCQLGDRKRPGLPAGGAVADRPQRAEQAEPRPEGV